MAEHSRFYDSLDPLKPDKVYTADEFTSYFRMLVTTGIMKGSANMLKVETSGSNMNTTVDTGAAYLSGRQYENDTKLSLIHEVEALGKSRIDRVVVRLVLDMDARYIKAFVKKGVAGVSPIAPPLEQTGDVYEISLAQVKVIGGQTYINIIDVVDERGKDVICPWAGSNILPNFDDEALSELMANQLTDGPYAKSYGENIDDLKESGFYNIRYAPGIGLPLPLGGNWTFVVIKKDSGSGTIEVVQFAYSNDLRLFQRSLLWNGVWQPWVEPAALKANKQQSPWLSSTVGAGWNTVDSEGIRYFKDEFGIVHVSGQLMSTASSTTASALMTLPAGYTPDRLLRFPTGTSAVGAGALVIQPNGQVMVVGAIDKNSASYGINVTFRAVQ